MGALPPDPWWRGGGGDLQWGMKNFHSFFMGETQVDNGRKKRKIFKKFVLKLEFHNGTHFLKNGER